MYIMLWEGCVQTRVAKAWLAESGWLVVGGRRLRPYCPMKEPSSFIPAVRVMRVADDTTTLMRVYELKFGYDNLFFMARRRVIFEI